MAEAEDLDVELFINEVKSRPVIWNAAEEDYHNKKRKRNVWMNVCRVFCDGFDMKSESCKTEICNKLMKKWRNLKDNFIKQKRRKSISGHSSDSARPYMYFKKLSFLSQSDPTTDSQSSLVIKNEQEDSESNSTPPEVPKNVHHNHDTRKRKRDEDSSAVDSSKTPHSSSTTDPNPDRLFFESILPYMAGFTEDQKLEFRCEVLNAIKRIRTPQQNDSSHRNYGYPTTPNAQHLSSPYTSYDLPQDPNHQTSVQTNELKHRPNCSS